MITLYDCALLSLDAYKDGCEVTLEEASARGWRRIEFLRDEESGYAGAIYQGHRGACVLASRGTERGDPRDWRAVSEIGAGRVPEAQARAAALFLARHRSRRRADGEILLTGHSLGGVLAQLLAADSGSRAVTFNSPSVRGLLPNPPADLEQRIHNVHARGDIVIRPGGVLRRRLGEPLGRVTEIDIETSSVPGFYDRCTRSHAMRAHSMRRMARALQKLISARLDPWAA